MFPFSAVLLVLGSVLIDPAHCRQTSTGNPGSATWETDGKGNLSISMDAASTGEVSLRCRIRLPRNAQGATVQLDRAFVSFQPAAAKTDGSGLLLSVGTCSGSLVRVAGEDWIEARRRSWSVRSGNTVEVRITLRDNSPGVPVRIDLWELRLVPGKVEDIRVCQPVNCCGNR